MSRSNKKGEITVTLGVIAIIVTLFGVIVGSRSSKQIKTLRSNAQQPFDCSYESINEIHYKGTILQGVSGFRWQNSFIGKDGKNINGDFNKIQKTTDGVFTKWTVDDLRKSEYAPYKDKTTWVELIAIPSDYKVVGSFCNAQNSKDIKTCQQFCLKSDNPSNCHFGITEASARVDGLLISCGGRLTYGWDVLLNWEIPTPNPTNQPTFTPLPTNSPIPTNTPIPTRTPTPTYIPTPTMTLRPTMRPSSTPNPARQPTTTTTPTKKPTATAPTPIPPTKTQSPIQKQPSKQIPTSNPINGIPPDGGLMPTQIPQSACNQKCDYDSSTSAGSGSSGLCPIDYTCVDECPNNLKICPYYQRGVCRRSSCLNDTSCLCATPTPNKKAIPTLRPTVIPTRPPAPTLSGPTGGPTRKPTATVGPTISPTPTIPTTVPCSFESTNTVQFKQNQSTSLFTALNKNNTEWYTTNDLPKSETYFKKGQIIVSVPNFKLSPRQSNTPPQKTSYFEGDTACVTLHYDSDMYKISSTNPGPGKVVTPDKICELPLVCGPKYEYGWTIEKKTTSTTPQLKVAFTGDQGLTGQEDADPDGVLELIKNENAQALVIGGDFDYNASPDAWGTMMKNHLPIGYPLFVSAGNHDVENLSAWQKYQTVIKQFIESNKDAYCDNIDNSGVKTTCTYKGLTMIFSGAGLNVSGATENEQYFRQQLGQSDATWKICSWHRNMTEMQLGSKVESLVGWGLYEACREFGAIIATAHEHSYQRTKTLINMQGQVHDASCADPKTICLGPGRTFAFVSGLGGAGERRGQFRCGKNNNITNNNCNNKSGLDIWASVYSSKLDNADKIKEKSKPGALFITFNVDNDPNKARGYFKTIDGTIRDEFTILKTSDAGVAPETKNNAEEITSPNEPHVPSSISINAKITNYQTDIINAIEFTVCNKDSINICNKIQRKINVRINQNQNIDEIIESIDGNPIITGTRYLASCMLFYGNGTQQECGSRIISADNPLALDITVTDEKGVIDVISNTERELTDINRDGANNTLDCVAMLANYEKKEVAADANRDGTTNALDLSLCYKWLDKSHD